MRFCRFFALFIFPTNFDSGTRFLSSCFFPTMIKKKSFSTRALMEKKKAPDNLLEILTLALLLHLTGLTSPIWSFFSEVENKSFSQTASHASRRRRPKAIFILFYRSFLFYCFSPPHDNVMLVKCCRVGKENIKSADFLVLLPPKLRFESLRGTCRRILDSVSSEVANSSESCVINGSRASCVTSY